MNVDFPRGFIPYRSKTGIIHSRWYKSDGSAAIFNGDPVKWDGSGRILAVTATADNHFGISGGYVAATAGLWILVYDDLANTSFLGQADSNNLTDDTNNGNHFDLIVTTGDTTTLRSKMEVDDNLSADDNVILINKINQPGNAWGLNVALELMFRVDSDATVTTTT